MQIKFNNGKTFTYSQSFGLGRDFKDGYTRPSLEVIMPLGQISYDEIYNILNDENAIKHIELVGDEQLTPIYKKVTFTVTAENGEKIAVTQNAVDKDGNLIIENYKSYIPKSEYNNYNVVGKIAVEDGNISFKLYEQISSMEKERNEAIRAVDELLLAMEG